MSSSATPASSLFAPASSLRPVDLPVRTPQSLWNRWFGQVARALSQTLSYRCQPAALGEFLSTASRCYVLSSRQRPRPASTCYLTPVNPSMRAGATIARRLTQARPHEQCSGADAGNCDGAHWRDVIDGIVSHAHAALPPLLIQCNDRSCLSCVHTGCRTV